MTDPNTGSTRGPRPGGAPASAGAPLEEALDPGARSLADALKISFAILKAILFVLFAAFFFSGAFNVREGEVALRLRFGALEGAPSGEVLGPGGPYFAFPEPIDRVILVPTTPQQLKIEDAFWFEVKAADRGKRLDELSVPRGGLVPGQDGSLLTADKNIVHGRWSVTYGIAPADAPRFARYVNAGGSKAGMLKAARNLVRQAAVQEIIKTIAQSTADEVLLGNIQHHKETLRRNIQRALDRMKSGITVRELFLEDKTPPLAVRQAFREVNVAQSDKVQKIEAARQARTTLLNGVAGALHQELIEAIERYESARREGRISAGAQADRQIERLLEDRRAGGEVARRINEARKYRDSERSVVESEKNRFEKSLAAYRRQPRLFRRILKQETWQKIFSKDAETFYLPPGAKELYLEINRDPAIRRERERERFRLKKGRRKRKQ